MSATLVAPATTAPDRLKTTATPTKPEVEESSVLGVLERTRELLSSGDRWCKYVYFDLTNDKFCLAGAVSVAAQSFPVYHDAHVQEAWRLLQVEGNMQWGLPVWNDAPERTFMDVERVLDAAIYRAKNS